MACRACTFTNAERMEACEMCVMSLGLPSTAQCAEIQRIKQDLSDAKMAAEAREVDSHRPTTSVWQVPAADLMTLLMPAVGARTLSVSYPLWHKIAQLSKAWLNAVCAWIPEVTSIVLDHTTFEVMMAVLRRTSRLREVSVPMCHYAALDDLVELLARKNPLLRVVELQGCATLTSQGTNALLEQCPQLEALDLKGSYLTAAYQTTASSQPGCVGTLQNLRVKRCPSDMRAFRGLRRLCMEVTYRNHLFALLPNQVEHLELTLYPEMHLSVEIAGYDLLQQLAEFVAASPQLVTLTLIGWSEGPELKQDIRERIQHVRPHVQLVFLAHSSRNTSCTCGRTFSPMFINRCSTCN